jgi:hypothetical protein
MVFGLTILTTTLSNQTLSEKKQAWLVDYYLLEARVAEKLAEIDAMLMNAKEEAVTLSGENRNFMFLESIDGLTDDGTIFFTVSETDQDYNKHIEVELEIILPELTASREAFLSTSNYRIIRYSQVQDLFDYEDIKFGDPFSPNED